MAMQADALTQETLATPGPLPKLPGIVDCRHRWPFQVAGVLTLTAMQNVVLWQETRVRPGGRARLRGDGDRTEGGEQAGRHGYQPRRSEYRWDERPLGTVGQRS